MQTATTNSFTTTIRNLPKKCSLRVCLAKSATRFPNATRKRVHKGVEWVLQQLRSGTMDAFRVNVPTHGPDKYVVHNYQALHDKDGNYAGVNEYILDFKPIIDWYLAQTGQKRLAMSMPFPALPSKTTTAMMWMLVQARRLKHKHCAEMLFISKSKTYIKRDLIL